MIRVVHVDLLQLWIR